MKISINIRNLEKVTKSLKNVNARKEIANSLNKAIAEVNKAAIVEVPVDTTQLQKSHVIDPAGITKLKGSVYTNKEYAVPVHQGHRIVAWGRDTGRKARPNPWMERAVRKKERKIKKIIEESLDNIAKKITR